MGCFKTLPRFKMRTGQLISAILGFVPQRGNKKVTSVRGYNVNFIILTPLQDFQDETHQDREVMNLWFSFLWKKREKEIISIVMLFDFFPFESTRIYSDQLRAPTIDNEQCQIPLFWFSTRNVLILIRQLYQEVFFFL